MKLDMIAIMATFVEGWQVRVVTSGRLTMRILLGLGSAALLGVGAAAQDMQDHDMAGMHQPQAAGALSETGQSAFAAIAEATRTLDADPRTDWSKADIEALRDHLVDMDNVTMRADVKAAPIPGGARFTVTSSDPRVAGSIGRMVGMHAAMANAEGGEKSAVEAIPGGMALTVTGARAADAARIRGLGFFGLLTEGVHHQRHHLMLAKGESMPH
jgi:hypothetical protein